MNEWWGGQPDGLKQAFSLFPDGRWKEADLYLRINIRNYCLLKKGGLLPEDKDRSMLSEIVCELADTELCRANGKTLEDMCDTDGAFLEEYQELFNRIYDELEMRITDYMNGHQRAVFTPVSQGRRLQRGSRHLLQELDCGYASKCGKRSLRQFDLRPRVRGSRT